MDPNRLDQAADKNDQVARAFDNGIDDILVSTRGLQERMDALDARWDGVAQSRFFEDWEEEKLKTSSYVDLLEEIASGLRSIAGNLRQRAEEERARIQREEAERQRREEERRQRERPTRPGIL